MRATLTFLGTWTFEPVPAAVLVLTAAAYLAGVRTVARRTPAAPWPARHTAAFLGALALAWVVLLGPFGAYDDTFLWAHSVQHIVLAMAVAPLLLLGAPVLLLLRISSRTARRRWIVPVLRSRSLGWATRPAVGWLLFAGVLVGMHFSPLYEVALDHPAVHDYVEHPLLVAAALVYFYPLLSVDPGPHRVPHAVRALSLFAVMIPETMTGFFIYASNYLLYPHYATVARPFGPPPIVDQQLGGALMWGGMMLVGSLWVVLAVVGWLRDEQRRAQRIDLTTLASLAGAPGRAP